MNQRQDNCHLWDSAGKPKMCLPSDNAAGGSPRPDLRSDSAHDPLWTPEQVARRLNVSPDWVRDHSSRKELRLPVIRLGGGPARKTFNTFFFPVGDEIRRIVAEWVAFLREDKKWGNDDPLFPKTHVSPGGTRLFEVSGLSREHWSTASPIRKIFREAFERAGLPYSTRTAFETHWSSWAKMSVSALRTSRRGAKTSAMKEC